MKSQYSTLLVIPEVVFMYKEPASNSPSNACSQRRVSIRAVDQRSLRRSRRKFSSIDQPRTTIIHNEFKVLIMYYRFLYASVELGFIKLLSIYRSVSALDSPSFAVPFAS